MAEDPTKRRAVKRPREEEAWRNWKRKSAFNVFLTVEVPSKGYCDLIEFLKNTRNDIHDLIVEELRVRIVLKFYLTVRPQLSRIDPDGNETNSTPYLCSLPTIILEGSDIPDLLDETGNRIKELLSSHEGEGSGFTLDSILDCQLNIATYDVVGRSTHTPLPKHIQSKNATVNIKNKCDKNFLFCLSYVRKPVVEHAQRPSKYIKDLNNFDVSGIKFPVTLNQIEKFEQLNQDFSVNVFKLDKKKEINLIPLYTTPERRRKYHAHILQIGNIQKPHYIIISNMSRLLFDNEHLTTIKCTFVNIA